MTLADRIADVLLEHGPMPECTIATSVRKRRDEVTRELGANPDRFVHNGRKARASRWDVRPNPPSAEGVDTTELVARWTRLELESDPGGMITEYEAGAFVSYWIETGLLESVDGNGRVRVTDRGRWVARAFVEAGWT